MGRPSAVVVGQTTSTTPPLRSHLITFCSSPCAADWKITRGSETGVLASGEPASGAAAGEHSAGVGAACCPMSSAVVGWPLSAVHCKVWPRTSNSTVGRGTRADYTLKATLTHTTCRMGVWGVSPSGVRGSAPRRKNGAFIAFLSEISGQ